MIDEIFQENLKQVAPEDINGQREELKQPSAEDHQAKATAKCKPEVENVRRMVEAAMLKADEGTKMRWKADAEKHGAEETKASGLKAKAESAERKAEAAEREAQAARVVVREAVSGLEKQAALEVRRAICYTAKEARDEAIKARKAAMKAAHQAALL